MKSNLVILEAPGAMSQRAGVVERVDDRSFVVRTSVGAVLARRAVSCLVEPEAGDRVLVAGLEGDEFWLLAVLEREGGGAVRLAPEGDLELRLSKGRFSVAAQGGIDLATGGDIAVASGSLDVHTDRARVTAGVMEYLGATLSAEVERLKVFAIRCEELFETLSQRVKRSYRTVSERDQLRAEQIDYAARENLSLHGKNAVVTARELVKLDGEQIHLG
jgi:hypothetical protein